MLLIKTAGAGGIAVKISQEKDPREGTRWGLVLTYKFLLSPCSMIIIHFWVPPTPVFLKKSLIECLQTWSTICMTHGSLIIGQGIRHSIYKENLIFLAREWSIITNCYWALRRGKLVRFVPSNWKQIRELWGYCRRSSNVSCYVRSIVPTPKSKISSLLILWEISNLW